MRTFNLKFLGVILFTSVFLIGGLIVNTAKVEAANTVTALGVSYSMSSVINTTNADGSVTTKILVGCAPKSGDLYDVNTGYPCTNVVKTTLSGCTIGSGDIYDVNTGIACASYIKSVLVGCALKSGDIYDINTGRKCTNDPAKVLAKIIPVKTIPQKDLTLLTPIEKPTGATIDDTGIALSTESGTDLSGREILKNNLTASVAKAGNILKGPMSIWIILLIIVIILGAGYAVYSLLSKNDKKNDIKQPTKPITPNPTPVQPPLSATVKATPSVTEPIFQQTQATPNNNSSAGSINTPNPQGQIFGK